MPDQSAEDDLTTRFVDALHHLEERREVDRLVPLFADGATLHRPAAQAEPSSDPAEFWRTYRDQFQDIRSDFSVVDGSGGTSVLEWTSTGTLANGRDITYAGVSLLGTGEDGRIERFATYFDTAAFLEPTPADVRS